MIKQSKKQMLKDLKANQIIMITQKELDELKCQGSLFTKLQQQKHEIIDNIAHAIWSKTEIPDDCPYEIGCAHYGSWDCNDCLIAHDIYDFIMRFASK